LKIDDLNTRYPSINDIQYPFVKRVRTTILLQKKLAIKYSVKLLLLILFLPGLASAQTDTISQTSGKPVGLSDPFKSGKNKPRKKTGARGTEIAVFVPRNYFYASLKLPVEELATYLLTEDAEVLDYENQNGLMLDFGYGKQIHKYFTLEGGIQAYLANSLNLLYEYGQDEGYDEVTIRNNAYALQLKPIFTLPLDDEVSLRVGAALNYQMLRSAGKYYVYEERSGETVLSSMTKHTHRSRFLLNLNPFVGADFKISNNWGVGFDLSYVRLNWDKSISGLRFSSQPGLQLPVHKTSEVFLAIRVTFR
jgi:hypothetical protein